MGTAGGYPKVPNQVRRNLLKACTAATVKAAIPGFSLIEAGTRAVGQPDRPLSKAPNTQVRPLIGTGWHGHMFPGATAPFGMVQLSPDTSGAPEARSNGVRDNYKWDHSSGYHYPDNVVIGFSHTHLQGTGGAELGDVLMMPLVEGRNWGWNAGAPDGLAQEQIQNLGTDSGWVLEGPEQGYCSYFSHEQEVARPGYYSVHLQTPDVLAELTATTRCGLHRYTFSQATATPRRGMILDLSHILGRRVYHGELKIESSTRVSGRRYSHGWATDRHAYFVAEFSSPIIGWQVQVDGKAASAVVGDSFAGAKVKLILTFPAGAEPIIVRVGISGTGVDGASKNLAAEIPHWDFDAVIKQCEQRWTEALSVLEASLSSSPLQETFTSGVYHSLIAPATFNDVDGSYRGLDRKNHLDTSFTEYTNLSIWDIYRGEFPFLTMVQPGRVNDIIRTLLVDYEQLGQHSLPMWTLWGNETYSMNGFHAAGLILAAYTRGIRDFDVQAAYAAMRDTAMVGSWHEGTREIQEQFRRMGYVSSEPRAGVAFTLDLAYDYWCVGAMADLLGKADEAAMFYQLGQNYKNLFNPDSGFMQGRMEDGRWRDPFRPDEAYHDYVEADAWQTTFNVMQDVQGLIDLYGGDAQFIAKLDKLFTSPSSVVGAPPDISGMVGQDAQGNEPSNHLPYLYPFAGAAWKTQCWVRKVAALYNNTPVGIPGNDDCGQLSSWFAFAALGFYPVNAATGVYVIGSPMVDRAVFRIPGTAKRFTVVAENNSHENVYIRSVELNGKQLTRSWFTHAEMVAGGELRFQMSAKPNKEWASAPKDRPPSGLVKQ